VILDLIDDHIHSRANSSLASFSVRTPSSSFIQPVKVGEKTSESDRHTTSTPYPNTPYLYPPHQFIIQWTVFGSKILFS
jgi:hypothetical protein